MSRNITELCGLEPAATAEEIEAASRQYVRKVSGITRPTGVNVDAFEAAVAEVTATTTRLLSDEGYSVTRPPDDDSDTETELTFGRKDFERKFFSATLHVRTTARPIIASATAERGMSARGDTRRAGRVRQQRRRGRG